MRRAFALSFLTAALAIACVPALPERMLSGNAGVTGGGGSAGGGGGGGCGGGGAKPPPDGGGTSPDACAGCTIFILVSDAGGQPRNIAVGSSGSVYWVGDS